MWDKLGWLNWFLQFICYGLTSFNLKGFYYSFTWSCILCEGRNSFCMWLISRKLCGFLCMFSTGFTSLSVLLIFPLLITFFVFCTIVYSISSNIDEVLSINPSANVFVFRDFKACVCYFLSNFYFSQNDSPSKTLKDVFYFI